MPAKKYILIAVLTLGLINGAIGSRLFISIPPINSLEEIPFFVFPLMALSMVLYLSVSTLIFGRYARFFFIGMLMLGAYASSYGLAELSPHTLNAKPFFESVASLLLGSSILLGLYFSEILLSRRWAQA